MRDAGKKSRIVPLRGEPRRFSRSEHCISRADISPNALKVLYRLKNSGYQAFLVGGGVRDLLLGREPKDFDVATDALPEQVRELFRNSRIIGRRFRLVHVRFGREVLEVATLRASGPGDANDDDGPAGDRHVVDGRIIRDNVYGTIDEDVWRRDFTVNALYYDIRDFSVLDYTGGMDDVRQGILRLIGDPEVRYREDPVRMLRAVRFAVKLGFRLHPGTAEPIDRLAPLLADMPAARLYEEVLKLFLGGAAVQTFEMLRRFGLFGQLFPQTEACLAEEEGGFPVTLLVRALRNTDDRLAQDKPVTPAFLFAALLWDPVRRLAEDYRADGLGAVQALQLAGDTVISRQVARVTLLRRFSLATREIWTMQARLAQRNGKRAFGLLANPRFRAAYDFLLLRAESGEPVGELADWWTAFQERDDAGRQEMVGALGGQRGGSSRRRRRRRRS